MGRKFLLRRLTVAILLAAATAGAQETVREVGQLVFDGIPEIPERIIAKTQQYQNVRNVKFTDFAPGGGLVTSTRFGETDQIHHIAAPGGARRQLTFYSEPVRGASFGRADDWFLFNRDSGGNEASQIFRFDLATGEATLLTDGEAQNGGPNWSNRMDRVAWRSTARNQRDHDTWIMDPMAPDDRRVAFENDGYWIPVDWAPNDEKMLLLHYVSINESYVWVGDIATGEKTPFSNHDKVDGETISYDSAVFDASGEGVYYTSDEGTEFRTLRWAKIGSNDVQEITGDISWDISGISMSPDRTQLAFQVNYKGSDQMYLMETETNTFGQVDLPPCYMTGFGWRDDSGMLGVSFMSPSTPGNVYTIDAETMEIERWTDSEVGGLDTKKFVMSEIIEYESFDGLTVPAFLYKPRGEGPFPVVVRIHGGPEGQARAWFSYTSQYEVNELGCAVIYPNVRGSAGFGKTYLKMDNGFKREDSVKDIGALLDWIAENPDLDETRVAVTGGSYGGYMSLASLTHYSDRLRCGIDAVGISNFVTFLKNTKDYRRDLRRVEYGDERDEKMYEFLMAISPTNNVDKINVPLLVVQGANDPRVPASEAEQIVHAIRAKGKEAWYLLAKDEGHGFAKKFNRDQRLYVESLFWERYLLDRQPELTTDEPEEIPGASH